MLSLLLLLLTSYRGNSLCSNPQTHSTHYSRGSCTAAVTQDRLGRKGKMRKRFRKSFAIAFQTHHIQLGLKDLGATVWLWWMSYRKWNNWPNGMHWLFSPLFHFMCCIHHSPTVHVRLKLSNLEPRSVAKLHFGIGGGAIQTTWLLQHAPPPTYRIM